MEKSIQELLSESQLPKYSLQEVLKTYEDIDLTEDEMAMAVIDAKRKKKAILEQKQVAERARLNRLALTQTRFTVAQTRALMEYRADTLFEGKFRLDYENTLLFNLLCHYFSEDKGFEALATTAGIRSPSLQKGIMISGNFGTGKTWMMKLFCKNQRQVYHMRFAKDIANEFATNGEETCIEKFRNPANDATAFYHPFSGLCIDDIGTEDIKTHYGNRKNVVGDIIESRYSKGNIGPFLHVTTNFSAEQLKEFYGQRVTSRMREIFNIIELNGGDRRK